MHIQRLEIEGFKTFAKKTVIQFEKGISGVVGSNGSGKSNVVDAIKWVLGEQSAKSLRGQAMDDVIFMGAEGVEPAKFAKVSLVFSRGNEPFPGLFASLEEVEVARRLKRSGSSTYYLNRTKVRLRDVQNFFLDTGLSNKKYAVIEQGQIGNIVNATPNQMRALFEEAAGISRFKIQKEGTESKLVSTRENLIKVSIIVDGLEKQLHSLEKQARKAIRHRRLSSVLGQLERSIALSEYKGFLDDRKVQADIYKKSLLEEEAAEQALKRQWNMMAQAKGSLRGKEEQNNELQKRARTIIETLSEARSKLKYQVKEVDDLEERIRLLHEDEQRGKSHLLQREADLKKQKDTKDIAEAQLKEASVSRALVIDEHKKSTNQMRELDRQLDEYKASSDRLFLEKNKLNGENIALKQRLVDISLDLQRRGTETSEIEAQAQEKKKEQERLEKKKEEAKQELKKTNTEEQGLRQKIQKGKQALQNKIAERRSIAQKQQAQYRKVIELETRVESLRRLIAQHEGVPQDIRKILKHPKALGILAEKLIVPAEKEDLLLTALGEKIDVVLVDASTDANTMEELAELGQGRIQLLLVNQEKIPLGYFSDISGDELGLRALGQLLGTIHTVHHFSDTLGKEKRFVIPRQNTMIENGLLQKGKPKSSASEILARHRRILSLEKEVVREKLDLQTLEKQEEALHGEENEHRVILQSLEAEIRKIQDIMLSQKGTVTQLRSEIKISQSEEQRLLSHIENQRKQHLRLSQEEQQKKNRLQELEVSLVQNQAKLEENDSALRLIQDQRYKEHQVAKRLAKNRNELEINWGTLTERLSQTKDAYRRLEQGVLHHKESLERTQAQLQDSSQRRISLQENNIVLEEQTELLQQKHDKLQQELEKSLEGVEKWKKYIIQLEDAFRKEQDVKDKISQRRSEEQARLERIKEQITQINEKIFQKYKLELSSLLARIEREGSLLLEPLDGVLAMEPETEEDKEFSQAFFLGKKDLDNQEQVESWKEQAENFKTELTQFGNINFMAIQERLAIKEEFDLVVTQKRDLETSMLQIQDSISQLEAICSDRFLETVQGADLYFQEIYPKLLGGGASKIELEDPAEPLETGVRVWANPPGKKMKILSLLSGGEKAQVAIALLFALFRIKPSPLCLMDEVDAPLDVANGERFNTMLREMSQDSQFIIITHNKKTIEAVDLLYGVTIVSGVSQLVSVSID